jgi:hypothetical protein
VGWGLLLLLLLLLGGPLLVLLEQPVHLLLVRLVLSERSPGPSHPTRDLQACRATQ